MGSHRAPGGNGRVCYVSTLRVRIKSSAANEVERPFTGHIGPAWRELQARGELLSLTLAWSEGADDQYDLITHWASKDAHDRNADSFVAGIHALAVACYIAARPTTTETTTDNKQVPAFDSLLPARS